MFVNPLLFVALTGCLLLCYLGMRIAAKAPTRSSYYVCLLLAALLCLPALSFNAYYAHLVGEPSWYITFRSLPGVEILAACWGLLLGLIIPQGTLRWRWLPHLCLAFILTIVPFLKPIVKPAEAGHRLANRWSDGVCLQTTGATCGPASLATIYAYFGKENTERAIARASYSSSTGTELWYLIRYARRYGLTATTLRPHNLAEIPVPAIIGATLATGKSNPRSGHFVTLLGREGDKYVIGDPLVGREVLTDEEFTTMYGTLRDAIAFQENQR